MATATLAEVLSLARTLSPEEQHDLVEALSTKQMENGSTLHPTFPPAIYRGKPIHSIEALIAPFWPPEESADDIVNFIREQREADRDL